MQSDSATAVLSSPVGPLFARVEAGRLRQLSFLRNERDARTCNAGDVRARAALDVVRDQLTEYFQGRRKTFDLPLHLDGPPFSVRVWEELRNIPYGETISYGQLAQRVGAPDAARAVGAANGANPIAIIVPCHRVIGADGGLVGYGGGLARKQMLLDLERGRMSLAL